MKKLFIFISFVFLLYSKSIFADALDVAIENIDRTPENMQRDQYRNPKATLNFFAIKPNMSVIELWPSRGLYSEILNPFLESEGDFIGADFDPNYGSWTPKVIKR
ncbi:MAG: methyltransferase, partial [Alphaproteobacteria bacterium]|nr:methyltransferase [Alphaproteobacteria bacterium]